MATYKLKRKNFTVYDDTDNLKRMKDADILAEQKKKNPGMGGPLMAAAGGVASGAILGGAGLGIYKAAGKAAKGARLSRFGKGLKRGSKLGAIAGGSIALIGALNKRSGEVKENEFYNDRLEYAQRQARRRERKDWKSNMTNRDGYSF